MLARPVASGEFAAVTHRNVLSCTRVLYSNRLCRLTELTITCNQIRVIVRDGVINTLRCSNSGAISNELRPREIGDFQNMYPFQSALIQIRGAWLRFWGRLC